MIPCICTSRLSNEPRKTLAFQDADQTKAQHGTKSIVIDTKPADWHAAHPTCRAKVPPKNGGGFKRNQRMQKHKPETHHSAF